jgi:solute carrier family 25 oxoglutarate transporter 11
MVGLFSGYVQQAWTNFSNNWKSLMRHYEPPANLTQLMTATLATTTLPNYLRGWHNRLQYVAAVGSLDIAMKVALYRQFNNGWQNNFAGFDYGFHRKIPTTAVAALLSAPLSIAVEMAKNAYYADKTYPK